MTKKNEFFFSFLSAAYLIQNSANEGNDKEKPFFFSFLSAAYLIQSLFLILAVVILLVHTSTMPEEVVIRSSAASHRHITMNKRGHRIFSVG